MTVGVAVYGGAAASRKLKVTSHKAGVVGQTVDMIDPAKVGAAVQVTVTAGPDFTQVGVDRQAQVSSVLTGKTGHRVDIG